MAKQAKRNITPEGRAAMTRAGKRTSGGNFAAMKAGQLRKMNIRHEVDEFRRDLTAKVNVIEHPGAIALIRSAAASFAAICQLSQRLSVANAKNTERFSELLPTIQSELRRTLALLGVAAFNDDHGAPPSDDTPEGRREWAKRYVDSLVPEQEAKQ